MRLRASEKGIRRQTFQKSQILVEKSLFFAVYFLCFWDVWSIKILFLRCSDRYFPFFFLVFSVFCTRYFEVLRYLKRLFGESHHHFWPLVLIRLRLRVSSGNRSGTPWVLDYQLALENQETGRNPMLTNQLMRLWASHRVWEHKLQRLAPSAPGSRSRCPGFFLGIRYVPRCTKTPPHPTPPPGPRPPNVDSQNSSIWNPMLA